MEHTQGEGGLRRRLSDKIEDAFNQACRQGQTEVAACMLKGLDQCLLGQPTPWERRKAALLLLRACATRLSLLRDAQAGADAAMPGSVFSAHEARVREMSHTTA